MSILNEYYVDQNNKKVIRELATPQVLELIKKYEKQIDQNDFATLYNAIPFEEISNFTMLMLIANIDPLDNLKWVPSGYLKKCKYVQNIAVPNHIKNINPYAFAESSVKTVFLTKNIHLIWGYVFTNIDHDVTIEYEGSSDDWDKIEIEQQHLANKLIINCNETKEVLEFSKL